MEMKFVVNHGMVTVFIISTFLSCKLFRCTLRTFDGVIELKSTRQVLSKICIKWGLDRIPIIGWKMAWTSSES